MPEAHFSTKVIKLANGEGVSEVELTSRVAGYVGALVGAGSHAKYKTTDHDGMAKVRTLLCRVCSFAVVVITAIDLAHAGSDRS